MSILTKAKNYIVKFWQQKNGKTNEPHPVLSSALDEIDAFNEYAKSFQCPGCHKRKGLTVTDYERGKKGWELHIVCKKCGVSAVLNNTGFCFSQLEEVTTK